LKGEGENNAGLKEVMLSGRFLTKLMNNHRNQINLEEEINRNMKGKFKLFGHIGLALFLVSALVLALAPVVQAATEVTEVWMEFPSTDEAGDIDGSLYFNKAASILLWRIHFTPTTALERGVDTITVQFYDGLDSTMGPTSTQDTYDVEFGSAVTTANNYDIDPDAFGATYGYYDVQTVSQAGYRVTVTTPCDIAAGQEAWLLIDDADDMITSGGPNNTSGNTTAYKVKVYTSKDTTPVLSNPFYHGSYDCTFGASGTPVEVSPSTAGSFGQYTFTFSPSSADYNLTANTDTITVTFPYGTTVPSSISASTISVYDGATEAWYTCGTDPVIDTDLRTVKVTVPHAVTYDDSVNAKIKFTTSAGITNPTYAQGDYGENDVDATNQIGFIRTSKEQLDIACSDSYGYTITEDSAETLDFDYSAAPTLVTGLSDKYTMINMYSSPLYLQVEDQYGNLCDTGDTATAQVTLESSSGSGNFFTATNSSTAYSQITTTVTLVDGAKSIYYRDSAAGTHTLTATYTSLDTATLTMQVCPGVQLYDRYDNLIHTYAPTASDPVEETNASSVTNVYKGGKYIDMATDAAVNYDVIVLGDGHYEVDNSTNYLSFGNSYLTIESLNGADYTTIDGSGQTANTSTSQTISTSGTNLTFDGLTITNLPSGNHQNRGIYLRRNAFTVQNCKFANVPGDNIILESNAAVTSGTITNNTFTGLGAASAPYRAGIWIKASSSGDVSGVSITNNTFTNNNGYESCALILAEEGGDISNVKVSGNTISNCFYGIGTYEDVTGLTGDYAMTENTISDCTYGLFIGGVTPAPTLNFKNNTISGFTLYGVKSGGTTSYDGTNVDIQYNDITGTGAWAIYNTDTTSVDPDCKYNWFGDATGPSAGTGTYASTTARGNGEAVTQGVTFTPWLHKSMTDVVADNASYQAVEMKLVEGWNTLSTPVKLVSSADSIDELLPSGMSIGYYYDEGWQQITTGYTLSPCDAVYVKMDAVTYALVKFDAGAFSTPSKDLKDGWNLASLAYLNYTSASDAMNADDAVASVAKTAADLPGYSQVISPSLNANQTDIYGLTGTSWAVAYGQDDVTDKMYAGLGYWIYMQNAATLAGFELTPIVPDLD
jgi:hypothetical protein